MIATVGLAPGLVRALTPDEDPDDLAELIDRHDSIIEVLRDHAVVVVSSEDDLANLKRAVNGLKSTSPDVYKRWETLLTFLRKRRRLEPLDPVGLPPLDSLETGADLLPAWKDRIELAALPSKQALMLGVDRSKPSAVDPGSNIEVAKGHLLRRSRRIARYAGLAKAGVVAHQGDRDEWMTETLMPVFGHASAVDIVDHYLYGELVWRRDNGVRGRAAEHVAWLIDALGKAGGPPKRVRLLGGVAESGLPRDAIEAADLVRRVCPALGPVIEELLIVGGRWKSRDTDMPHDRHISTNLGLAIEIPAGLSRFRSQRIEDSSGVSWTFRSAPSAFGKCTAERERILSAAGTRTVAY